METTQEIMHENCQIDHNYLVEMGGRKYAAKFKGYNGNSQYTPTFEIVGYAGEYRILKKLD
jgi:hypothetical protein